MSAIKDIRELTGLSYSRIAAWLGVSKSLIQFVENDDRNLPSKASTKLSAMTVLAQQMKAARQSNRPGKIEFSDPAKLAARHQKKMEFHERSAIGLRIKLRKLKALHPQINSRLEFLDAMKKFNTDWYSSTEQDKTFIEMIEWFSKERLPSVGLEEQDLLLDKIETHIAYAELHKQRWEKFSGMIK